MRAAAELRVPVTLLSGPGAAGYAGPDWFAGVIAAAKTRHSKVSVTAILDCADAPGRALAALRRGAKRIRLAGNRTARARVQAIAAQLGAQLDDAPYAVLDLSAAQEPERAARDFLKDGR